MKFFNQISGIKQASLILIVGALLSKAFGFIRELVIAYKFGTGQELDVYLIAFTIPTFIVSILMYTIPSTLIPIITKIKLKYDKNVLWQINWGLILIYSILILLISIAVYFLSPILIKMLAPGLAKYEYDQSVYILKVLTIYLVFASIFPIFKSISHSEGRFLLPTISQFSLHLLIITSVLLYSNLLGNLSIAYGICLGAFFQLFPMIFNIFQRRIHLKIKIDKKILENIINVIVFIIIIEIIGQFYTVIDRYFASKLPVGSISSLNYAQIILMLPISIFGISIGSAIFPTLGECVINNEWKRLRKITVKAITFVFIIGFPITLIYIFGSNFIIKIIFQRAAFDAQSTLQTSEALQYYTIGLMAIMIHTIYLKLYYSLGEIKILLYFGIIILLLKIGLSYFLIEFYYHSGLALATSISFIFNVILMTIYLIWIIKKKY